MNPLAERARGVAGELLDSRGDREDGSVRAEDLQHGRHERVGQVAGAAKSFRGSTPISS
ncbi:hypothetical protein [Streptomyces sp. NPDC057418]|uniref:hypothetical protein n=1 Tax=Streptomyces sp. NPDC057418 TaxID=3346126 RepID=UPI003680545F